MNDYTVVINDEEESHVSLVRHGGGWDAVSGEAVRRIEILHLDQGEAILRIDGDRQVVPYLIVGEEIHLDFRGEVIVAEVSIGSRRKASRSKEHSMAAPMPALVMTIVVEPGQQVAKGDSLLILEAMKMEHQVRAPHAGIVAEIRCKTGDMVQPPDDLVVLTPMEPDV